MTIRIYHNPRCSKSRQTLAILQEKGINPEVIEYLKKPPSISELDSILQALGMEPEELMRTGEVPYKELVKGRVLTRAQLLELMVNNPVMIERPIVVNGSKAVVGRPPENVLAIL